MAKNSIALFKPSMTNAVERPYLTLRGHDERILHIQSNSCLTSLTVFETLTHYYH
jgi:hypothetical protein